MLGPRPSRGRGLSPSRAALLETLQAQAEPVTLGALAVAARLHENTVREHLDALLRRGLVSRTASPPTGQRGRPAWLYEAVDHPPTATDHAGLAAALAWALTESSADPVADALAAGREWGRRLAGERAEAPEPNATAARRRVVALFDDLGFDPRSDDRASSVRLTRCPLLEVAHRHPDVVCAVHLGMAQAALEHHGADPDGARLHPFSEPGACRLRLAARSSS